MRKNINLFSIISFSVVFLIFMGIYNSSISKFTYYNMWLHSFILFISCCLAFYVTYSAYISYNKNKDVRAFILSLAFYVFGFVFLLHAISMPNLEIFHFSESVFDVTEHYGLFLGSFIFLGLVLPFRKIEGTIYANRSKLFFGLAISLLIIFGLILKFQSLAEKLESIIDLFIGASGLIFILLILILLSKYKETKSTLLFYLTIGFSILINTSIMPFFYEEWNLVWWYFHLVFLLGFAIILYGGIKSKKGNGGFEQVFGSNHLFFKIGSKILIGFLLLVIASMAFIVYLNFSSDINQNTIIVSSVRNLENIADTKATNLNSFFDTLTGQMRIAQNYYNIKTNLPVMDKFLNNKTAPQYVLAKQTLDEQLKPFQEVFEFEDIMLINPTGEIVYVTSDDHRDELENVLTDVSGKAFEMGKKGIYISEVYSHTSDTNDLDILITGPVHDSDGTFIGVIAFEMNLELIYDIVQDTTGLGMTGETIVGTKQADRILFLSPFRHDKNTSLKEIFLGEKDMFPIQEAVQGKEGSGISVDHRGKEVIATWRYLPLINWGLVTKIDTDEAFATSFALRNRILLIGLITTLLVTLLSFFISNSISKPIIKLRNIADEISKGNMDVKAEVTSDDEIGQLTSAFNKMTKDLKDSRKDLENKVRERTSELQSKIDELERFSKLTVDRELKMIELKKKIKDMELKK